VWRLHEEGFVREARFRSNRVEAVFILEATDVDEARHKFAQLPFVTAGLTEFEIILLVPSSGISRLFAS
jgi:hypothetical protein